MSISLILQAFSDMLLREESGAYHDNGHAAFPQLVFMFKTRFQVN